VFLFIDKEPPNSLERLIDATERTLGLYVQLIVSGDITVEILTYLNINREIFLELAELFITDETQIIRKAFNDLEAFYQLKNSLEVMLVYLDHLNLVKKFREYFQN